MGIFVLILWFILSIVIASAASERGRSSLGWFLFAILFSPLIAGLCLLLFPPLLSQSTIDDRALQASIRSADQLAIAELRAEPSQQRGVGSWILVIVVLGFGITLTVFGIAQLWEDHTNSLASPAPQAPLDYASVAALPCSDFLNSLGTDRFLSLSDPVADFIKGGFGSAANINDYVLTECRLNERYKIGDAVEKLFDDKKRNSLPWIPIGGATSDPQVQASWEAFDKWIHMSF